MDYQLSVVAIVALGLGFVALLKRGGNQKTEVRLPGVKLKNEIKVNPKDE